MLWPSATAAAPRDAPGGEFGVEEDKKQALDSEDVHQRNNFSKSRHSRLHIHKKALKP